MAKSRRNKKSGNWVRRQNKDQFVRQARQQGLRARSAFKLEQIDKKYRLIRAHSRVVDLGAAPGSWCQYAAGRVKGSDQIVAVDKLNMAALDGIHFIQGDFLDEEIRNDILEYFKDAKLDLVLSDMAPNITGIAVTDQARAEELQHLILEFCYSALNLGGNLLTKLFEGESVNQIKKLFANHFEKILMLKPDASRSESREIYLLALGYKSD